MNNCLLCKHCCGESEDEYGLDKYYVCYKREIDEDPRFPYKNTKCKYYEKDTDLVSLINKDVSKELWKEITWEVK